MRSSLCQAASQGLCPSTKGPDEPTSSGPPQTEETGQNVLSLLSLLGRSVQSWHTCSTGEHWGPLCARHVPGETHLIRGTASALRWAQVGFFWDELGVPSCSFHL